jgi:hypothetical protein
VSAPPRALGVQLALERYEGSRKLCWLANTDADCEVPVTWLQDQVEYANAGVAAVAGIIDVDSFIEHDCSVPERFRLLDFAVASKRDDPHTLAHLGAKPAPANANFDPSQPDAEAANRPNQSLVVLTCTSTGCLSMLVSVELTTDLDAIISSY